MEDAQGVVPFYIDRYTDYNSRDAVRTQFSVTQDGAQFDDSTYQFDDADSQFDGVPVAAVESDKFLCNAFSFKLSHANTTGPLNILGVRPIGR